jgi:hypothetical protein
MDAICTGLPGHGQPGRDSGTRSGGRHRSGPHIDAIDKLFAAGATIVNIHSGQEDQKRVIDFYGNNVLPKPNIRT